MIADDTDHDNSHDPHDKCVVCMSRGDVQVIKIMNHIKDEPVQDLSCWNNKQDWQRSGKRRMGKRR